MGAHRTYTLCNPLYHWTHLELQRYFGITKILNGDTARRYTTSQVKIANAGIQCAGLLAKMKEYLCTTDDPGRFPGTPYPDDRRKTTCPFQVFPTAGWAMNVDSAAAFNDYVGKLKPLPSFPLHLHDQYLDALEQRHDFFASGSTVKVSDHGLEQVYAEGLYRRRDQNHLR